MVDRLSLQGNPAVRFSSCKFADQEFFMTTKPREDRLLAEENAFYEENKKQIIEKHINRHVLIKGRKVIGSYLTVDQAAGEGVRRFGTEPFLVRLPGEEIPVGSAPALALGLLCHS